MGNKIAVIFCVDEDLWAQVHRVPRAKLIDAALRLFIESKRKPVEPAEHVVQATN